MKRSEFPRVSPESVGIPSSAVLELLDALENGPTQMHGLMVMRYGKVCAEGWWNPYAPGKRHTCHSLTKTYMGTAIGIALREGLLKLDDRIIDLFPEYRDETTLSDVTVRHVLCMASGVTSMPSPSEEWIRDFFRQPQVHKAGTAFFYNSAGSTFLGFIVERVSGEYVYDYLKPRLFNKIGIDSQVSFPILVEPQYDMWGHRMQATTEDNLRLMKLYADGGCVDGERILDEEYVRLATSLQNDSASEAKGNPLAADNHVGYGFQMWMCKHKGAYRADGAGGQFSIVTPDLQMQISITEAAVGAGGAQFTLDCIWDILLPRVSADALPENEADGNRLRTRLGTLAIPAPLYRPYSPMMEAVSGRRFAVTRGYFDLYFKELPGFILTGGSGGSFSFDFRAMDGTLAWEGPEGKVLLDFAMDGTRRRNSYPLPFSNVTECFASGYWSGRDTFELVLLWTESVVEKHLVFRFDGTEVLITGKSDYKPGNPSTGRVIDAAAVETAE